jgi:hypothetical protein
MSLAVLLREGKPTGHKVDKVLVAYEKLPAIEKQAFVQLVKDPIWSGPQIAAVLREMGHDIQGDQVQAFRNKLRNGKVTL